MTPCPTCNAPHEAIAYILRHGSPRAQALVAQAVAEAHGVGCDAVEARP